MTTLRSRHALVACVLALCAWPAAHAQTAADLRNDAATPGDVLTYGMGYANQRYSPLKRIDKKNVAKLVPVWNYSLNNSQGQESQPIIYDGVMYVTTHTSTVAVDALTGKQIWKQELEFGSDVFKMACCGLLNRGAAIMNGKVYRSTLDSNLIAYDAKTGKQLWKSKAVDYKLGHAMTAAPLIANGVLISGMGGGEIPAQPRTPERARARHREKRRRAAAIRTINDGDWPRRRVGNGHAMMRRGRRTGINTGQERIRPRGDLAGENPAPFTVMVLPFWLMVLIDSWAPSTKETEHGTPRTLPAPS